MKYRRTKNGHGENESVYEMLKDREREEEKAIERKRIRVETHEREKVCERAREDTFAYIYT